MAANFFEANDYALLIQRIEGLDINATRKLGKMDMPQMLHHCGVQLKLALGEIEEQNYEGSFIMRTSFGVWFSLYAMPWSRGLPTPSKMNLRKRGVAGEGFQREQSALLELLARVQMNSDLRPHPFFGSLNKKDWGRLIWKHLDHHLNQFGH